MPRRSRTSAEVAELRELGCVTTRKIELERVTLRASSSQQRRGRGAGEQGASGESDHSELTPKTLRVDGEGNGIKV